MLRLFGRVSQATILFLSLATALHAQTDSSNTWMGSLRAVGGNARAGVFVGGDQGKILRSTDGGKSWKEVYVPADSDRRPVEAIAFCDEHRGIAVGAGGLTLASTDGGEHWTVSDAHTRANLVSLTIVPAAPGQAWAVGSDGNILRTTDAGANWTVAATGAAGASGSYALQLPNVPTTTALVRIVSEADTTVADTSDALFSLVIGKNLETCRNVCLERKEMQQPLAERMDRLDLQSARRLDGSGEQTPRAQVGRSLASGGDGRLAAAGGQVAERVAPARPRLHRVAVEQVLTEEGRTGPVSTEVDDVVERGRRRGGTLRTRDGHGDDHERRAPPPAG